MTVSAYLEKKKMYNNLGRRLFVQKCVSDFKLYILFLPSFYVFFFSSSFNSSTDSNELNLQSLWCWLEYVRWMMHSFKMQLSQKVRAPNERNWFASSIDPISLFDFTSEFSTWIRRIIMILKCHSTKETNCTHHVVLLTEN